MSNFVTTKKLDEYWKSPVLWIMKNLYAFLFKTVNSKATHSISCFIGIQLLVACHRFCPNKIMWKSETYIQLKFNNKKKNKTLCYLLLININKSFICLQNQALIFTKNKHVLNALLEFLSWKQEKGLLSLFCPKNSWIWLNCIEGINIHNFRRPMLKVFIN